MSMARGFLGAVAGGALGAGLWAAVSYFTGYEIGWIAWAVGGLVGAGMAWGAEGRGGQGAAVLAAAVALGAVLLGKFSAAHYSVRHWVEETSSALTLDDARDHLAMKVQGQLIEGGVEISEATGDEGYATVVVMERDRRWAAMDKAERESYLESVRAEMIRESEEATGALTILAFIFSFGVFDLVFGFLAVTTAYKIGGHRSVADEDTVETADEQAGAPAIFRTIPADVLAPVAPPIAPEAEPVAAAPAPPPVPSAKPGAAKPEQRTEPPLGAGIWARIGPETERTTRFGDARTEGRRAA